MTPENVSSVMRGIRRDHPRRIEMKFCMVAGLQETVLRLQFHQNRLSGFEDLGVEICLLPLIWPNQWENGQINEKEQISTPHSSVSA